MYVCTYVCTLVRMCVYTYIYIYICIYVCMCMYVYNLYMYVFKQIDRQNPPHNLLTWFGVSAGDEDKARHPPESSPRAPELSEPQPKVLQP